MTQNNESSNVISKSETNINAVANGKKRRRKRNNLTNTNKLNEIVIPQKTKAPNNQRTRKKINRHEKRSTQYSERIDRKACFYCGHDYNFTDRTRISLSCHVGHVRTSYY